MTSNVRILRGDVLSFARHYKGPRFHAALLDPPYEIGMMGREWDKTGVAFDPATRAAFMDVLLPGAFGLAFASSRGWHRLACAIEDAGFIIHPSIFAWSQSQGFPKSTRVDRFADQAAGVKGGRGDYKSPDHAVKRKPGNERMHEGYQCPWRDDPEAEDANNREYLAASEMGQAWKGFSYGRQAMKPSVEPIILFQKPYERGGSIHSILKYGAGALNIDGARIGIESTVTIMKDMTQAHGNQFGKPGIQYPVTGAKENPPGRWPANFVLQHDSDCVRLSENVWQCTESCPVRKLGEQSRFFFNGDWALEVQEQLDNADQVFYCAKASRKERDAGLGDLTPTFAPTMGDGIGAREHNPDEPGALVRNVHPTVKPIKLNTWLASLLLPPDLYAPRRMFVPFAGAGNEVIGAMRAGWDEIVGVERERDYVEIGRRRIRYWGGFSATTDAKPVPGVEQQGVLDE